MTRWLAGAWAIASREYASFFRTPIGWIVVALFLLLSSIVFSTVVLQPGGPATMRPFFQAWWSLLIVVAPAISMRLLSEEIRTGTIELMLTAPVSEAAIVAGKYLAAVLFLATMLLPTVAYALLLARLSTPDFGPVLSGYLGVLLLGMLYLAIGTLASAVTASQTLAFLATLVALTLLDVVTTFASRSLSGRLAEMLAAAAPSARIADFAKGVIDTGNVVFFLAASFWMLAAAAVALQSRRWR